MKTRAAVAHKAGAPLTVETVDLEGPRAGEVLVEIKATGICHTDEFTRSGADPEGLFPAILGHEGAGIVVDIGPGVTTLAKGDHVIPLYTPECRQCEYCLSGKTNRRLVHGRQNQHRRPDHPPSQTRRHQPRIRPDAQRRIHPQRSGVLNFHSGRRCIGVKYKSLIILISLFSFANPCEP